MMARMVLAPTALLALAMMVQSHDGAKKVPDELQGEWKAVAIETAGKKPPDASVKVMSVVIKDDRFTLKNRDKVVEEVTLEVDPTKDPKQITLTPVKGPRKGMPHPGIYAVEKGRLKVCWAPPGKDRPTRFESTA